MEVTKISLLGLRYFTTTVNLFQTHESLFFGEATIAAYMEREGIECLYLFDDDFDTIQILTRLETPDNPS